ncbi:hypothetical protein CFP56_011473 [Quercus suber]|uniref:Uncharacterized protein n=1 Tax=Quercus suber TaxID=58331 RepID=A0AAW0M506_QUESU
MKKEKEKCLFIQLLIYYNFV